MSGRQESIATPDRDFELRMLGGRETLDVHDAPPGDTYDFFNSLRVH
jgi:hypothetical protein